MKTYTILEDHQVVARSVSIADTFLSRFLGLMPRKQLSPGEGLLLLNCSSIHCFFMHFPIDVVYLDSDFQIVGTETVQPWHWGKRFKNASHVLEIEEGGSQNLVYGTHLKLEEITSYE